MFEQQRFLELRTIKLSFCKLNIMGIGRDFESKQHNWKFDKISQINNVLLGPK